MGREASIIFSVKRIEVFVKGQLQWPSKDQGNRRTVLVLGRVCINDVQLMRI